MWKVTGLLFVFCLLGSMFAHLTYYDDVYYNRPGFIDAYDNTPGSYGYGGGYGGYRGGYRGGYGGGYGGYRLYPRHGRYRGVFPRRRYVRSYRRYRRGYY